MKIAVDGFGGDNAPLSVLEGSAAAVAEYGVEVVITGDSESFQQLCEQHQISTKGFTFVKTESVLDMHDDPTDILGAKKDSSMAVALKMVADGEADAFVSAGSTGGVVVGATLITKRIKGVKRCAITTVIPTTERQYVLIDSGANVDCRPEMLVQFALMGSAYAKCVLGIENPKVGLVNNGTEESKGGELQLAAHELLKQAPVNFIGNIEARELALDGCDVAVCDGFTGNIILKNTEGVGKAMANQMKSMFMSGLTGKLAGLMVMKHIKAFKKKMDYTEYGGAPMLGSTKPVIKAHGSSNAKSFKNAIRQAKLMIDSDIIEKLTKQISETKGRGEGK